MVAAMPWPYLKNMSKLVIKKYVSVTSDAVGVNGQTIVTNESAADFGDFMRQIYHFYQISWPKFFKMDALSKLGFIAAKVLLHNEDNTRFAPEEKAIVIANRSSSLNTDVKYNESINDIPSPAVFVYTLPNILEGEISIHHNLKGENAFFVQEKPDVLFLVNYVNILFKTTCTKKVITGWVEMDVNNRYNAFLVDVENEAQGSGVTDFSVDFIKNQLFES